MVDRDDSDYFKDLLHTVLETCADAVIMADLGGVVMIFNEDAEALLRRKTADALGEDLFAMLFSEEDVPRLKAAHINALMVMLLDDGTLTVPFTVLLLMVTLIFFQFLYYISRYRFNPEP